jgi:opacity protein-like surface antigen
MKKIMITLALACGIFTAASAAKNEKPWANGKLQVSANQRFLQFENGQPFFLLGDTGWLLPERLDRAEAQYYLQKCRVAGFNTVLIQVMDGLGAKKAINSALHVPCPANWIGLPLSQGQPPSK